MHGNQVVPVHTVNLHCALTYISVKLRSTEQQYTPVHQDRDCALWSIQFLCYFLYVLKVLFSCFYVSNLL